MNKILNTMKKVIRVLLAGVVLLYVIVKIFDRKDKTENREYRHVESDVYTSAAEEFDDIW